ncbi:coproporphyrinogen III oxidase [Dendrothele bispora CBS 962.96]|uniref:coproporphyrinogen oxidase n=1 Tax=Dendrothele bispora (strain CBS 962.96) TaxID=1314807 RepID=A0A4S8MJL4_DENBC|nr:coproporphyrinogen III oxidase [Dendrothele bispora CBS 962.96]
MSSAPQPMRQRVEDYIRKLQDEIVLSLENIDPNAPKFKRDSWLRPQGGSGQSCVFAMPSTTTDDSDSNIASHRHESVLEKAGVNISIVHGTLPPPAIKQMRADHSSLPLPEDVPGGLPFFAAGISLVIHPRNPNAPTAHANYRYFEITETNNSSSSGGSGSTPKVLAWWFGGGADLTPSYLIEEDAVHFHKTLKDACAPFGSQLYPTFKKWCDEYFYLPHRGETRGVGGLFFDDLSELAHVRLPSPASYTSDIGSIDKGGPAAEKLRPETQEEIFEFIQSVGNAFVPSYVPIVQKRTTMSYTPHQRRWQLIRRGRYVEFNLVYDRGTKFGLMTPGARVESILMSLPETARWEYMCELGEDQDTEEGRLMGVLKNPRDWL